MATADINEADDEIVDYTKPPFLRRVRIRGYKSIAFCDVTLEPLTVLVGRNGAGKSNFLDALAFLRDAVDFGASEAVKRHGGWSSILCKSAEVPSIEFELHIKFRCGNLKYRGSMPPVAGGQASFPDLASQEFAATYTLIIDGDGNAVPVITREDLELTDCQGAPADGYKISRAGTGENYSDTLQWRDGVSTSAASKRANQQVSPHRRDHTLLGAIGFQPFLDVADGLRFMAFYNPHPDTIRRPQRSAPSSLLEKDGRNLASVISGLQQVDPKALHRAKQYVAEIIPEVNDFSILELGSFETIRFLHHSSATGNPLELDAGNMSDGTLRALSNIIAAFQQVPTYGHPSVIGIEEPETALHPAAMRALVDALRDATQHTQILITTHSADLLDDPYLDPRQILVVRSRNGQTEIAPIGPAGKEIVAKELYSLGDLQRMDHLEPDEENLRCQTPDANGKPEKP